MPEEDIVQRNLFVYMERNHLDGVPAFPLPAEYSARWYERGDEQAWVSIQQQAETHAEVTLEVFRRFFGSDFETLHARQCFLLDAQQVPIATATAWYEKEFFGEPYGRVHWVAVVPRYQGRGLSKPLLSLVLTRMAELGHQRAFLRTSTARIPAIDLYQQFGFLPSQRTADDFTVWQQLNGMLPRPFDL